MYVIQCFLKKSVAFTLNKMLWYLTEKPVRKKKCSKIVLSFLLEIVG